MSSEEFWGQVQAWGLALGFVTAMSAVVLVFCWCIKLLAASGSVP